ncbi:MAG: zinc-binding dehydrogenase [Candidatus Eisenbacteria bacterium]|nr:zinc-binding dehydrogenase [Candidatus Eisenbacteria bacterium]
MRAIVFHEHGEPDVLTGMELPDPVAGPGQVVVAIETASLNRLDLAIRKGLPGIKVARPHVLGCEGYGHVAALGSGVRHLAVGDPVIVTPGTSCLACEACARGEDSLCREYRMVGYQAPGCYAEQVVAPAMAVFPADDRLTPAEWAALPLVYLTAWRMLMTRARLAPGETVLVQAAGSGVGMAAIQIARMVQAHVIATAGSAAKVEKARAIGAHEVIDYAAEDVAAEVKRLTLGRGVDVVVEHTGAATWEGSLGSLRRGGRLVTCGATDATPIAFDLRHLFVKQFELLGSYMGGRHELMAMMKLAGPGKLQPVIDRVFPLSDAAMAHRHLDSRAQFGKVVLSITEDVPSVS